jgi:CPA1 family monovalent cation:H+ antiporter
MALAMPPSRQRDIVVAAAYVVVVFSVIVQSLTLEQVIVRLGYGRSAPEKR